MTFFQKHLYRNVDSFSLGLIRFLFGAFMLIEMYVFLTNGFFKGTLISPFFHFNFDFFDFVSPMGETAMSFVHILLALSALLIMIGYYSRWASLMFFTLFMYFILCCKGHFNNHFYLMALISLLFSITDADRSFSIRKKNKEGEKTVPVWQYNILRIQLVIVYFFGGIAKLNPDWLVHKQPMKKALEIIGGDGFLTSDLVINFFTYSGLMFDLFIGFLLLYKKTRWYAVIGVILFNFTNAFIFDDIGIFPFLMLAMTLVFFDPDGSLIKKIKEVFVNNKIRKKPSQLHELSVMSKPIMVMLTVYFSFQILFPLRHHVITDNVIWTGISRNFSWHMKVQHRGAEEVQFLAIESDTGQEVILNYEWINARISNIQIKTMVESPVMVWQFGNWIEKRLLSEFKAANGKMYENIEVYSRIKTSFNGRDPVYIVDPSVDLTEVNYDPFGENSWLLPAPEDD